MKIDVVIPYVNGEDAIWKKDFDSNSKKIKGNDNGIIRYRDYGMLKYVLRSISYNLPFVNNIFIVVSGPSQVPSWLKLENDRLKIIYHKDFIPKEHLPTFNVNTIELYLFNIKELSRYFIYFNDDIIVTNKISEDYFIKNGIVANDTRIKIESKDKLSHYDILCCNNVNLLLGTKNVLKTCSNHSLQIFDKIKLCVFFNKYCLSDYITQFRDNCNVTQHAFHLYMFMYNETMPYNIRTAKYTVPEQYRNDKCVITNNHFFEKIIPQTLLIQDSDSYNYNFNNIKSYICKCLHIMFPKPCEFEKQDNRTKVSIVIPAYNAEQYIKNTIDSIKNQKYKNFECIIVDDCSTDNTFDIIQKEIVSDERFRVIRNEKNKGVSYSRNVGIQLSSGQYICFSDADDDNSKYKLTVLSNYLDTFDDYCVGARYNSCIKRGFYDSDNMFNGRDNKMSNVNVMMYRKDFLEKNNIHFDEKLNYAEDLKFNKTVLNKQGHLAILDKKIYTYNDNPNSLSKMKNKNKNKHE